MAIDRNNYEAFMLDYLEGRLDEKDKLALFAFLEINPDLKPDLDVNIELVLPSAKQSPEFDKSFLKKHRSEEFGLSPIDYLYVKQKEEGLSKAEKEELSVLEPSETKRLKTSAQYAKTELKVDKHLQYRNKAGLKRLLFLSSFSKQWFNHVAAVLVVLLLAGLLWYLPNRISENTATLLTDGVKADVEDPLRQPEVIAKVFEKKGIVSRPPSKDSLLKIAKDPMGKSDVKPKIKVVPEDDKAKVMPEMPQPLIAQGLPAIAKDNKLNAYEHGLNVMMPQYMSNNILRRELAEIYRQWDTEEHNPPRTLALVESGVKVLNFFSKDAVSLNRYYDVDGNVVGYRVEGTGLEVQRKTR